MKLKTKSLISVTLMTVLVSIVIVYVSNKNSDDILRNNLENQIKTDTLKISNHIKDTKFKIEQVSILLTQSANIISSLNLISNYEDKNSYQAIIFDKQKSDLLEYSRRFFEHGSFFAIVFFDKLGNLVAKQSFNEELDKSGYVTYDKAVAYFKSSTHISKLESNSNLSTECVAKMKTKYENGYYKICDNIAIEFEGEHIGHINVIYYFGNKELEALQKNLVHPVSFSEKAPHKDDFDISIIDKELEMYIKHKIDFSYIEQKRQELITTIIFVVILLSTFIFFMFLAFIDREILKPLKKLQGVFESMLHNKYKNIEIQNNDEIGKIFQASNKIFAKFWENYSSLQSYQKSVDTSNLVTKTDLKGNIIYANEIFCQTSGYKEQEVIGKPHNIVRHKDIDKKVFEQMWSTIKSGKTWRGTIKNKTKSGGFYWTDAVISPTYDVNEHIDGYISIRRDITELMQSKEDLEFRANYDLLTKLGSRDKLHEDLKNITKPFLALINIDRFSQINDFYGHSFGDTLLQEFSKLLQQELANWCREGSFTLYRYGGDEFAVLVGKYDQKKVLESFPNLLENIEKTHITLEDKEINLTLSCGISFENATQALLSADMALKISQKEQKPFVVYSEKNSLDKQYANNLLWARKLKIAIAENRVVPFFQPIVNNSNLVYEKYEALVRIVEPDGKVISPFFFLDIAKQTKQYLELTQIMVEKSFEIFKDKEVEFSINLTMEDISNLQMREYLFAKLDVNPDIAKRLVLELVESESIEDYGAVVEFINIVKSKGCKIAIDDFGSGYSNFEYLIKLQADYIKIDGSLIKNINTQKESFVVVSTIVSFAKQMGIKTIAEFIEDEEIFKTIQEIGIDYSQGYYFQAPQKDIK